MLINVVAVRKHTGFQDKQKSSQKTKNNKHFRTEVLEHVRLDVFRAISNNFLLSLTASYKELRITHVQVLAAPG